MSSHEDTLLHKAPFVLIFFNIQLLGYKHTHTLPIFLFFIFFLYPSCDGAVSMSRYCLQLTLCVYSQPYSCSSSIRVRNNNYSLLPVATTWNASRANFTADYDKSSMIDSACSLEGRDRCVQSSDVTLHESGYVLRSPSFAMHINRLIELFFWTVWREENGFSLLKGAICQTSAFLNCFFISSATFWQPFINGLQLECILWTV